MASFFQIVYFSSVIIYYVVLEVIPTESVIVVLILFLNIFFHLLLFFGREPMRLLFKNSSMGIITRILDVICPIGAGLVYYFYIQASLVNSQLGIDHWPLTINYVPFILQVTIIAFLQTYIMEAYVYEAKWWMMW